MLYPTLSQPLIVLVVLFAGFLGGLIFDFFRILTTLSGNDRISKHFFDFLATLFSVGLLFFVNLWLNYGRFRLYVIAVFLSSFLIERLLSKILWTKLLSKWYTSITRRRSKREQKKQKPI